MARPGDIIENPRIGARMVFLQTGRETSGELMEADLFVRPRNKPPPKHIHPFQEERFKVIDGSFTVWTPRREVVLGPGDQYAVPKEPCTPGATPERQKPEFASRCGPLEDLMRG